MSEYVNLNPKAKACMRVSELIGAFVLEIVLCVGYFFGEKNVSWVPDDLWYILVIIGVVLLLGVIIVPEIRYRRYKYLINDEKIDVIEGLWFVTEEIAPIERIHQITVQQGPIDRAFGLGKVEATTAGGVITIRFLEKEIAQEIADKLQKNVGKIVRKQKSEDGHNGENEIA